MKINLGCGNKKLEGYYNCDREININFKLPFSNDSIEEVLMDNVLEHAINSEFTLKECKRILEIGGMIRLFLPHYRSPSAYRIGHHGLFSWKTFAEFPEHYDIQGLKVVTNNLYSFFRIRIFFPRLLERFIPTTGLYVELIKE